MHRECEFGRFLSAQTSHSEFNHVNPRPFIEGKKELSFLHYHQGSQGAGE